MFEFDKDKIELNKRKNGISFESAKQLWRDSNRIEIPTKWVDEERFILIAMLEKELWSAVFTLRERRIRIISVRKARDNEKEIYNSSRI